MPPRRGNFRSCGGLKLYRLSAWRYLDSETIATPGERSGNPYLEKKSIISRLVSSGVSH